MQAAAPVTSGEPIVLRSDDNGIATLTLNRPQQFNALSMAMLDALQTALEGVGAFAEKHQPCWRDK